MGNRIFRSGPCVSKRMSLFVLVEEPLAPLKKNSKSKIQNSIFFTNFVFHYPYYAFFKMKLIKLIAMCLLTASLSASAQKKTEILLWDENPLEQSDSKSERVRAQDFKIDPAITVYTPKNPTGVTVLMCLVGGYYHQAISHEGYDMAEWCIVHGITIFLF